MLKSQVDPLLGAPFAITSIAVHPPQRLLRNSSVSSDIPQAAYDSAARLLYFDCLTSFSLRIVYRVSGNDRSREDRTAIVHLSGSLGVTSRVIVDPLPEQLGS